MESKIKEGQKLKDGDCVYGISLKQTETLLNLSGSDWTLNKVFDSWVYNGGNLYPTYLEFCEELEKYEFEDFKQLCINTFNP